MVMMVAAVGEMAALTAVMRATPERIWDTIKRLGEHNPKKKDTDASA